MNMPKFIKRWYEGEEYSLPVDEFIKPIVPIPRYKRHWSSRFAHALVEFYLKEWKWLWFFLFGLIASLIAITKCIH